MACFGGGCPILPVYEGEIQCLEPRHEDARSSTTPASRCIGEQGELVCTRTLPFGADRLLGRRRRLALSRDIFRALPERLVARRPRDHHFARRTDRARPLRCRAESRRRAHRHGRNLSSGREDRRKSPSRSPSRSNGAATCASCCSSGCARADARRSAAGQDPRDDPRATRRRATCLRSIVQAPDLPRTINGKLVELAVRDVVHGRPVQEHRCARESTGARLLQGFAASLARR